MSLTPGTTLGPYSVTAKIGEGGMGEVYRARDTKLGRDVALKVLPDLFADDPERLARFQREARVQRDSGSHQQTCTRHDVPRTPAAVRFLSCEPLLGFIDLSAWLPCYCDEYTSDRRGVDPAPDAGCG